MVLAGVSRRATELLHLTSLDMVWPIYADRREAIEALLGRLIPAAPVPPRRPPRPEPVDSRDRRVR